MIYFEHVSKRYGQQKDTLTDVNFHLPMGEMAFLTGHSGAGKSTLLKLITGIEFTSRGQVTVNGANLSRIKTSQVPALRRQMGIVFQNHQLLYDRSVFDNVALPLKIAGYHFSEIERRVRAALDKVGLLRKEKVNPVTLSGGEQQRVGIARAVVNRPLLLLADEPTGNLDPQLSNEIMTLFRQFNAVGVTVLIATHDLSLIQQLNYPRLTLEQGRLIRNELGSERPQ
ncbi:MAG TPA: cell division ATP-binding protein FtsE [Gammaproteobacteria bacterium]|nr:cell division ATP-binding protein FtsE [Gammaproteobacteria bacterium]